MTAVNQAIWGFSNVNSEHAADGRAAAEIPAGRDAGEDVPFENDVVGAAEDVEGGRLQFDGPVNFKYRDRRFVYVKGSKHEGRLVQCETCGGKGIWPKIPPYLIGASRDRSVFLFT